MAFKSPAERSAARVHFSGYALRWIGAKLMEYEQLSDDAKEVLKNMVEFCINHSYCMGMDEGVNLKTDTEHLFVTELRAFSA